MNVCGIVFIAILVLCAMQGWKRGLIVKLRGVLSLLISCALVSALLPLVTEVIRTQTPLYENVAQQAETLINTQTSSLLDSVTGSIDSETAQYAQVYGLSGSDVLNNLTRIEQTKLIQSLPVPSIVQKTLLNYNNSAGYSSLGATDFAGYLARFAANEVVNIAAFLVTLLVVWLIVRAILGALNLLVRLPLIYEVNRVGGLLCGVLQGVFVIWAIMLILSMFSGTALGASLLTQADANTLLSPIFESNLFLRIVTQTTGKL